MKNISLVPIAYVKNSSKTSEDDFWDNVTSKITKVDKLPEECLEGIEAFSRLEVIFYFDKSTKELRGSAHPRENNN